MDEVLTHSLSVDNADKIFQGPNEPFCLPIGAAKDDPTEVLAH